MAGWSEFGVLGNGTDHEYNKAEGTVKLTYVPQATPERVQLLVRRARPARRQQRPPGGRASSPPEAALKCAYVPH
jgi:hypothetical protein